MTVEEFLDLKIEGRAELEDGILYMMAGGTPEHAALTANVIIALGVKLRGSGCRTMSPDFVIRTGSDTLRMPDASVYCGAFDEVTRRGKLIGDPRVVVEVLSPSPSTTDQRVKLNEYCGLGGLDAVVFVNPETQRVRLVERTGDDAWSDTLLPKGSNVRLASLGMELSHVEIFDLS